MLIRGYGRTFKAAASRRARLFATDARLNGQTVGFVGLGKIGNGMAGNMLRAGARVVAYDPDSANSRQAEKDGMTLVSSAADVVHHASVVFTALPDDRVLSAVAKELLPALVTQHGGSSTAVHISCSTVSPTIVRSIGEEYMAKGVGFVAAPVFARPDGMRRGEATIPVSGPEWAKQRAKPLLAETASGVHDFGEDPGAACTVKLGGNFLIAAAIESLAETAALAESHGVDREQFVALMNSTIFDCLIYRGYGHRVAARDHFPYPDAHFALDLGSKDVGLVHDAAIKAKCPMPIASILRDRFVAAQNSGRGKLDWSALALKASEEAGAKVNLEKLMDAISEKKP